MPREKAPHRGSPAHHPDHSALRPILWITIALLFLVPTVFVRTLLDAFEFPKMELLATGAVLLWALAACRESARIGAVGGTAWVAALPRRLAAWVRADPLGAGVAAYLGSALISTVFSMRPALSFFGAPESFAGLKTGIATTSLFFASRSLASNPRWFHIMAKAACVAAAIAAGYALLQLLKLDPYAWAGNATFGGENRVFGTLAHPNLLGAYLVMSLPLIARVAARTKTRLLTIAWMLVGAVAFMIVLATLSRGAWISLAVAGAAYVLLVTHGARATSRSPSSVVRAWAPAPGLLRVVLLALFAVGFLLISAPQLRPALRQRISQIADLSAPTTQSRRELWKAGLRMGADHPILGAGLDCYGSAFPAHRSAEYVRIEWGGNPTKAHSEMINIFATQGSLGVVTALAVVFLAAGAIWRSTASRNPVIRGDAVAAGSALAGFAGQALTGFTVVAVGALAAALAGWLAWAAHAEAMRPEPMPPARNPSVPSWMAGLVILAGGAAFFVPVILTPWRAARVEYAASRNPIGSPSRAEGYARAAALLPWYDRYEWEAGRSLLIEAVQSRDQVWETLERARQALENAIRIDPGSGTYRAYLARVLSSEVLLRPTSETRARVSATAKDAAARDPLDPYVIVLAEQSLMAAGLDGEARELAFRCTNLYPDFAQPFADIGSIALRQNRYGDAADTLAIAVRKDWREDRPGQAVAWENLSTAYMKLGKYGEAQAAAESALRLNPDLPSASENRLEAIRLRAR